MELTVGQIEHRHAFFRLIDTDQLAHAYLLVGPSGVGKAEIATWVAQRLLCASSERPCGTCTTCVHVQSRVHPDVIRMNIEADKEKISVESARTLASELSKTSLFAGWKIAIIENGERLSPSAANALLKTIEEPTPKTVILITTNTLHGVLPTIVSRCAVIRCGKVSDEELRDALQAYVADPVTLDRIVSLADGRPQRAAVLLADDGELASEERYASFAQAVLTSGLTDRLRSVDEFIRSLPKDPKDRVVVRQMVRECIGVLSRKSRAVTRHPDANTAQLEWLHVLAQAPALIDANVAPRTILEAFAMSIP
ncbi:MAG: DNA polymerase III subunit [Candidatus Uhrbacteria bacterium]